MNDVQQRAYENSKSLASENLARFEELTKLNQNATYWRANIFLDDVEHRQSLGKLMYLLDGQTDDPTLKTSLVAINSFPDAEYSGFLYGSIGTFAQFEDQLSTFEEVGTKCSDLQSKSLTAFKR